MYHKTTTGVRERERENPKIYPQTTLQWQITKTVLNKSNRFKRTNNSEKAVIRQSREGANADY